MRAFAYRNTEAGIKRIQAAREAEREALRSARLQAHIDDVIAETTVIKSEFRRIEERACRVFKVTTTGLKSARRHARLAMARQFVSYWAMRRTLLSSPQIGRLLGGRDHTTILHGRDAYRKKREAQGRFLRDAR